MLGSTRLGLANLSETTAVADVARSCGLGRAPEVTGPGLNRSRWGTHAPIRASRIMVDALTLEIGKEICPGYQLKRPLGRGGYGCVWEAEKEDHILVALKFLTCGLGLAASKEIRAISALNQVCHPNLITIEKVWCQANYLVIEMKLADGNLLDLLDICKMEYGTGLPADQTCFYLGQAAEGLDFL